MKKYQKIFGTGPAGFLISLLLFSGAVYLAKHFTQLHISDNQCLRYMAFGGLFIITVLIVVWSIWSLPPTQRGNKLITNGAFKYSRHPLYGAFLSFFNFGLAFLLNNWIYIFWAMLQHPVWHWVIRGEERLMEKMFPGEYVNYALKTGRFFPRLRLR